MPKPVLSDSLFNAEDVATAILNKANLQVANNELGVSNINGSYQYVNGALHGETGTSVSIYYFMGFVFLADYIFMHSAPASGSNVAQITNSDYFPLAKTFLNISRYQGDTAEYMSIETNGDIRINNPHNAGSTGYYMVFNGVYRAG